MMLQLDLSQSTLCRQEWQVPRCDRNLPAASYQRSWEVDSRDNSVPLLMPIVGCSRSPIEPRRGGSKKGLSPATPIQCTPTLLSAGPVLHHIALS